MRNTFSTLSEAIIALKSLGVTEDLNLCDVGLATENPMRIHSVKELNVVQFYRFEGVSDPEDNMVL